MELWKNICGFQNYQVSNRGRVKNIKTDRMISSIDVHSGYLQISLYNKGKRKSIFIHILVANSFISNPNNLPHVKHCNNIKTDNRAVNLDWMRKGGGKLKPVIQRTKNGKTVEYHDSIWDAARKTGVDYRYISNCCNGIQQTAKGYMWAFKNNSDL